MVVVVEHEGYTKELVAAVLFLFGSSLWSTNWPAEELSYSEAYSFPRPLLEAKGDLPLPHLLFNVVPRSTQVGQSRWGYWLFEG